LITLLKRSEYGVNIFVELELDFPQQLVTVI